MKSEKQKQEKQIWQFAYLHISFKTLSKKFHPKKFVYFPGKKITQQIFGQTTKLPEGMALKISVKFVSYH